MKLFKTQIRLGQRWNYFMNEQSKPRAYTLPDAKHQVLLFEAKNFDVRIKLRTPLELLTDLRDYMFNTLPYHASGIHL
jgi:hypothetical protein